MLVKVQAEVLQRSRLSIGFFPYRVSKIAQRKAYVNIYLARYIMFVDGIQFWAVLIVHNIYKLIYCNICVFFGMIST